MDHLPPEINNDEEIKTGMATAMRKFVHTSWRVIQAILTIPLFIICLFASILVVRLVVTLFSQAWHLFWRQ